MKLRMDDPKFRELWLSKRDSLRGKHQVPVHELFTPEFILRESSLKNFDDFVAEAKVRGDVRSVDDMTDEERIAWDLFIRTQTRFTGWPELLGNASSEWLARKIRGEEVHTLQAPPKQSDPAKQKLSREDLNRIEKVLTEKEPPTPPAIDAELEAFDPERILYAQVDSWIQRGFAFRTSRTIKGLPRNVELVIAYLRRGKKIETLLLEPDLVGLTYLVRRTLVGHVPIPAAENLYFTLLDGALREGEGSLLTRFLRIFGVRRGPSAFDLGVDLFNAVRGNDPEAIANSLEAIAKAYLPEGAGLDAILAGIEFIRALPPEQIELALDFADLLLTIVGFIPGAGEPADAAATGLAIARGNTLDAVLSGVSLVPLVGLLAAVPKLALLINKIRTLLAGLGSQTRQIVSDLITSISNVLSKWPASNDGSAASTIKAVLVQLKEVFQDTTTRLRRSKAKSDAPSDAPSTKLPTPEEPNVPDAEGPKTNSKPANETTTQPNEEPARTSGDLESGGAEQAQKAEPTLDPIKSAQQDRMTKNRTKGAARQARVKQKLESWLKNKYVEVEQYLRDANGKIVKDPLTGESRRLDIVVHDGKNAHSVFEVTSKTARKDVQSGKERRIRSGGGSYIRSRVTGKLIDISKHLTRIMRRK